MFQHCPVVQCPLVRTSDKHWIDSDKGVRESLTCVSSVWLTLSLIPVLFTLYLQNVSPCFLIPISSISPNLYLLQVSFKLQSSTPHVHLRFHCYSEQPLPAEGLRCLDPELEEKQQAEYNQLLKLASQLITDAEKDARCTRVLRVTRRMLKSTACIVGIFRCPLVRGPLINLALFSKCL